MSKTHFIKWLVSLLLMLMCCSCLVACDRKTVVTEDTSSGADTLAGSKADEKETAVKEQYYQLGDTVATDIFEFTLDAANMTIALSNVNDKTYFSPKEYNAQIDSNNPFVAPKGHTFAAFTYTVTNLDRASAEFHKGSFASVDYNGKSYSEMREGARYLYQDTQFIDTAGKLQTAKARVWLKDSSSNVLLLVGETESRRAYVDMATDVDDLSDDFTLTVKIPNSDKSKSSFTYIVTEEGRLKLEEEKRLAAEEEARASQEIENAYLSTIAPIDEALQGAWTYEDTTITFTDGRFTYDYIRVSDGKREINEGDYIIGDSTIILAYDSGYAPELDYIFENGVLSILGEKGIPPVQFNYIKQK